LVVIPIEPVLGLDAVVMTPGQLELGSFQGRGLELTTPKGGILFWLLIPIKPFCALFLLF